MIVSSDTIALRFVTKRYPGNITALDSVNLQIFEKEVVGIIGANGSGKSTLIKIISGKLMADTGSVVVFQHDQGNQKERLKLITGYVGQDKALDPEMTGLETLCYFTALYNIVGKRAHSRIRELIATFDMDNYIQRRINTYSGGQVQRLHLAIGVIHEPQLLLLDEPNTALDPKGKAFLWDFVRSYREEGKTVMVVTHELENVFKYCSRALLLEQGNIIADGAPDEIVQTYSGRVLHIKFAHSIEDESEIRQQLYQLEGVMAVKFNGKTLQMDVDRNEQLDVRIVLDVCADNHLVVIECRWEEPGLANAYFNLTGKNIAASTAGKSQTMGKRQRQ